MEGPAEEAPAFSCCPAGKAGRRRLPKDLAPPLPSMLLSWSHARSLETAGVPPPCVCVRITVHRIFPVCETLYLAAATLVVPVDSLHKGHRPILQAGTAKSQQLPGPVALHYEEGVASSPLSIADR